jgi:hypothetical protein
LLPCPFCGGVAVMHTSKETVGGKSKVEFSIRCHDPLYDCGCSPSTSTHKTETDGTVCGRNNSLEVHCEL